MGDINFEVISAAENSKKFQITRFWKEKSVEDVISIGICNHCNINNAPIDDALLT